MRRGSSQISRCSPRQWQKCSSHSEPRRPAINVVIQASTSVIAISLSLLHSSRHRKPSAIAIGTLGEKFVLKS
nr:hypothetical protein CFP56_47195 [Quercus suber]